MGWVGPRLGGVAMKREAERRRGSAGVVATLATLLTLGCSGTREPLLWSGRGGAAGSGTTGADAGGSGAGGFAPWVPGPDATWQLQLQGEVDTSLDVDLYVVDLSVPDEILTRLRADGRAVACHFSAGSLEDWRGDDALLPSHVVGETLPQYPAERWLDLRAAEVLALKLERVAEAASRGCTAVQPANLHGFLGDTGFPLTREDALSFAEQLASAAHAAGLSISLSDGDAEFLRALRPTFDFALGFGCLAAGCPALEAFRSAGLGLLVVEIGDEGDLDTLCPTAAQLGLRVIIKRAELDAVRLACP